jgi:hypothetical protein
MAIWPLGFTLYVAVTLARTAAHGTAEQSSTSIWADGDARAVLCGKQKDELEVEVGSGVSLARHRSGLADWKFSTLDTASTPSLLTGEDAPRQRGGPFFVKASLF